jgi:threonine/homoserine/homoserine lactone efflux protein
VLTAEFLVLSLIVVVSPGAGTVYTLSSALSRGPASGIVAAFGCTLGIVPHLIAALTGVAAFLHANPVAFEILRYLGVAYLLFMAYDSLRENGPLRLEGDAAARSFLRVVVSAVLINLLNPKLSLFFIAFLPQFISPDAGTAVPQMLVLSGVFMAMTLAVFIVYAVAAALVRQHVVERPAILVWLRRIFAGTFLALGARLALTN